MATTKRSIMTIILITTPTVSRVFLQLFSPQRKHPFFTEQPDTDSDGDAYGQRYAPSSESLGHPQGFRGQSESSTPTFFDYGQAAARDAYPAWSTERQIPLSKEEIEDIFLDLTQKFGFQRDSMRNMVSRMLSNPSLPPARFLSHNVRSLFSLTTR